MTYANAWLRLNLDLMRLGMESSNVIALRMMKLAAGGAVATAEAERMVAEKVRAAIDVQTQAVSSALAGQGHLAATRAVSRLRRTVRANQRRLAR